MEAELQGLIYTTLINDAAVSAFLGDRVYDRIPDEKTYPYASFGSHQTQEDDSTCIIGGEHFVQLDVWSREGGKVENKRICAAIRNALHEADLSVTQNALVYIRVPTIRVFDDTDRQTAHGVVSIEAAMEQK